MGPVCSKPGVVSFQAIAEIDALSVLDDRPNAADAACHDDEIQLLKQVIQSLPLRCGQVITLRKIYGLSHTTLDAAWKFAF